MVLDQQSSDGRRFIEWRFKPGQRLELHAPVERWENQLVLPAEAIVEEGAERFVYRRHGAAFERVPVHVEYNDGRAAVVGQVCELSPGDVVAGKGAFQMHLQMKNADGGAVDTHAGHSH